MARIKGKALMVITRLHDKGGDPRFDTHTFIQSCSGDWATRDWVQEEFSMCDTDTNPVPIQAYRIEPGDTIRIAVRFDIRCGQFSDGEGWSELDYTKAVVRRHQPYRERYLSKAARA